MYEIHIAASKKEKYRLKVTSERRHQAWRLGFNPDNRDFTCIHCRRPVSAERIISGVGNRNHCPYCLASKHVDLVEAGDRLSACRQPMPAVALTLKRERKKYVSRRGELMVVHLCADCGKVSANRLAADDDPERLWLTFEQSLRMEEGLQAHIESAGILPIQKEFAWEVKAQLFGNDSPAAGSEYGKFRRVTDSSPESEYFRSR